MNMRKMLYVMILMAVFSTLLINPVSGSSILVFAPLSYAPPHFAWWGQWAIGGASLATLDPSTGYTVLDANPGAAAAFGIALSWFSTGSYNFTGPTQKGSVHFDNWLRYTITAFTAGFRVFLWTLRWKNGTTPEVWTSVWSYAILGSGTTCADVGIHPNDLSWPSGINFEWANGYNYMTRVLIMAYAAKGSRAATDPAKYDQVVWNAYTSSPSDWKPGTLGMYLWDPEQLVQPVVTPQLSGIGFAPESTIYVYCDDKIVNKTLSDKYGNFTTSFTVPPNSTRGHHIVKAIDQLGNMAEDFFDVFLAAPPLGSVDLNGDGRINIKDIVLIAVNFGKTDPNVDPPETATAKDVNTSMLALALIAAVSIGFFGQHKRQKVRQSKNNIHNIESASKSFRKIDC